MSDFEKNEAELVGDGGHFIALHDRDNAGREKWRIHNQAGERVGCSGSHSCASLGGRDFGWLHGFRLPPFKS